VLRLGREARARLDADDAAAEAVGVAGQVFDRVDVDVARDGDGELRVVVVRAQVLDRVAVPLHVGRVGQLGPRGRVDVDVALRETRVERARLGERLHLDVVAERLEPVLQQVGRAQAVRPRRQEAEGDRVAALTGAAVRGIRSA